MNISTSKEVSSHGGPPSHLEHPNIEGAVNAAQMQRPFPGTQNRMALQFEIGMYYTMNKLPP